MKKRNRFEKIADVLLRGSLRVWFGAATVSCALQTNENVANEDAVPAAVKEAIRSGTLAQKRGVIQILAPSGGNCTAAMISFEHAITAAHCLGELLNGASSGFIQLWVRYYDPALPVGTWRWVTNDPEQGQAAEWFFARIHPDFEGVGDWGDDLAILQRWNGQFAGTTKSDYLRLSNGTCDQIDRAERFGAGDKGFSGEQDHKLRKSPVNVYSCYHDRFYDLPGGDQICKHDSGGPVIGLAGTFDVITGLTLGVHGAGNNCAESGDVQWHVRMTGLKVNWLQEQMFDITCWPYTVDNHLYRRCWE
jgi:hypothetical protein